MSLMSPLREHTSTFAEERELIEEEQEEDHFQKRVAQISMQRWARKSRQIPAINDIHNQPIQYGFMHRNRGEFWMKIEVVVQL